MIDENLRKIRSKLGLSVAKFADKLKMSANTLTNYEQNRREPSATLFVQLNKELNVNLNWLVTGKGEMFLSDSENSASQDEQLKEWVVQYVEKTMKDKGL